MKPHQIRYIKSQLMAKEILSTILFINTFQLGFFEYKIYISLAPRSRPKCNEVARWLNDKPRVAFVGEPSSHYNLVSQVLAITFFVNAYRATWSRPRKALFKGFSTSPPVEVSLEQDTDARIAGS